MDLVVIDLINDLIEQGVPLARIESHFNRFDVSNKARTRLREKYFALRNTKQIKIEKAKSNELSKSVFEFLGVDLSQAKLKLES